MDSIQQAELETIARLAAKAWQKGIKLYFDCNDRRHYASSASTPGLLHYVTLISCNCAGFAHHGRCMHNSALQLAFLLMDGHNPEPTACPQCHDSGTVEAERSRWVGGGKLGYRSVWTVKEPCACQFPELDAVA